MVPLASLIGLLAFGAGCPQSRLNAGDAGPDADAGPVLEPCETPGDVKTAPCPLCGTGTYACHDDRFWHLEACDSQGVCESGTTDLDITPACGRRERTCSSTCSWGDWTTTQPDQSAPACDYGAVLEASSAGCPGNFKRFRTCTDQCVWSEPSACGGGCSGTRRTAPDYKEEICIPAGPAIRGCHPENGRDDCLPPTMIEVDSYYVSRYPVTWRFYQECVDARACSPLELRSEWPPQDNAHPDSPIWSATYAQAQQFCAWDGGRRLPTAEEWEKAAKGPAPRNPLYPWGDDDGCARMPNSICDPPLGGRYREYDRFDAFPLASSYYGVELMWGGYFEYLKDFYRTYGSQQPGIHAELRGRHRRDWANYGSTMLGLGWRYAILPDEARGAIRCVRSVSNAE